MQDRETQRSELLVSGVTATVQQYIHSDAGELLRHEDTRLQHHDRERQGSKLLVSGVTATVQQYNQSDAGELLRHEDTRLQYFHIKPDSTIERGREANYLCRVSRQLCSSIYSRMPASYYGTRTPDYSISILSQTPHRERQRNKLLVSGVTATLQQYIQSDASELLRHEDTRLQYFHINPDSTIDRGREANYLCRVSRQLCSSIYSRMPASCYGTRTPDYSISILSPAPPRYNPRSRPRVDRSILTSGLHHPRPRPTIIHIVCLLRYIGYPCLPLVSSQLCLDLHNTTTLCSILVHSIYIILLPSATVTQKALQI
ncbi:hypothetical protein J6590_006198 [Homalodisca vitripennis]|nr:hypothetical protein J6590_006198 [Homalodisca vitripennis]